MCVACVCVCVFANARLSVSTYPCGVTVDAAPYTQEIDGTVTAHREALFVVGNLYVLFFLCCLSFFL